MLPSVLYYGPQDNMKQDDTWASLAVSKCVGVCVLLKCKNTLKQCFSPLQHISVITQLLMRAGYFQEKWRSSCWIITNCENLVNLVSPTHLKRRHNCWRGCFEDRVMAVCETGCDVVKIHSCTWNNVIAGVCVGEVRVMQVEVKIWITVFFLIIFENLLSWKIHFNFTVSMYTRTRRSDSPKPSWGLLRGSVRCFMRRRDTGKH